MNFQAPGESIRLRQRVRVIVGEVPSFNARHHGSGFVVVPLSLRYIAGYPRIGALDAYEGFVGTERT